MPKWGGFFTVSLHPLESEHYAVGTIHEEDQFVVGPTCTGAAVTTTYWKAAVVGIKAHAYFERYSSTQSLQVILRANGQHIESRVARPTKANLGGELFPNFVLNLPLNVATTEAFIELVPPAHNCKLHPVTIKYEIKTCGYKPGTPEKERYQTLQYSPAILTPDSQGRVELWKRWPVKPTPSAVIPPARPLPVQPASFSSSLSKYPSHSVDPRQPNGSSKSSKATPTASKLVVTGHTCNSASESKRKRAASEDSLPASAMEDSGQVALSKKARKRLNAELAAVQATPGKAVASPLPSLLVTAPSSGSSHPDTLDLLQSVNEDLIREIECLKVYERNRALKREVDQLRSQLGLPPADPLGLEAKMVSLGFAPAMPSQELSPPRSQAPEAVCETIRIPNGIDTFDGPSDRIQDVHDREESVSRWPHDRWYEQQGIASGSSHRRVNTSADAGSPASSHATPRQPVMNQERLKMLAQKAYEPIHQPIDAWDLPTETLGHVSGRAATGANSDPVVPSTNDGSHSVPKRRWGAVKTEPGADDLPSEPPGACEAPSAPGQPSASEHLAVPRQPAASEQQTVREGKAVSEQRCAPEQQSVDEQGAASEQQSAEEPEQGELIFVHNSIEETLLKIEEQVTNSAKASSGAEASAEDRQGSGEAKTEQGTSPPINNDDCSKETKVKQLSSPAVDATTSETGGGQSACKNEPITA